MNQQARHDEIGNHVVAPPSTALRDLVGGKTNFGHLEPKSGRNKFEYNLSTRSSARRKGGKTKRKRRKQDSPPPQHKLTSTQRLKMHLFSSDSGSS